MARRDLVTPTFAALAQRKSGMSTLTGAAGVDGTRAISVQTASKRRKHPSKYEVETPSLPLLRETQRFGAASDRQRFHFIGTLLGVSQSGSVLAAALGKHPRYLPCDRQPSYPANEVTKEARAVRRDEDGVWVPWPLNRTPEHKPHTIDPETGIWPMSEWGSECGRGFVSDSRFSATDKVIPRTNRNETRKWRAVKSP